MGSYICHRKRARRAGPLVKRDLPKRGLRGTRFVRACPVEMHMDFQAANPKRYGHV